MRRLRIILEMIKFEHTVFAMPFALVSVILAARTLPGGQVPARPLFWIVVAMVGARSAAMAFNRIVDAHYDARNPRTANRAIPAGVLSASQVTVFTGASVIVFELAAWQLNPLCLALSPVALAAVLGYSFTKRFTSLSHLALGLGIGIAPMGAWLAVTGRFALTPVLLGAVVMLWIGGFDIIYALQDVEFDKANGLFSLPRRLGPARALLVCRFMHAGVVMLLLTIGRLSGLHAMYFMGVVAVSALLVYEHSVVRPDDLRRVNLAFFTLNGWIGVLYFLFVLLDRLIAA